MYVRDFMQPNVITITSDTLITDAQLIMKEKKVHRLPVVDHGRLVGIVSRARLRDYAPSPATSLSIWELNFILSKIKVKEVMERKVITTTPDATIEEAAILGTRHEIGALPVMEGDKLVGIITLSDMFRLFVDIISAKEPGVRLRIVEPYANKAAGGVGQHIAKHGGRIQNIFTYTHPKTHRQEMIIRVATENPTAIIEEFRKNGYEVEWTT
jgi:acetoin utilization protein AcuB